MWLQNLGSFARVLDSDRPARFAREQICFGGNASVGAPIAAMEHPQAGRPSESRLAKVDSGQSDAVDYSPLCLECLG